MASTAERQKIDHFCPTFHHFCNKVCKIGKESKISKKHKTYHKKKKKSTNQATEGDIAAKGQKTSNEPRNKEQEHKRQSGKQQGEGRNKGNRNKSKTEPEQENKA